MCIFYGSLKFCLVACIEIILCSWHQVKGKWLVCIPSDEDIEVPLSVITRYTCGGNAQQPNVVKSGANKTTWKSTTPVPSASLEC